MDHIRLACPETGEAAVSELSDKNFGLLIAYILPGFLCLGGISRFWATVEFMDHDITNRCSHGSGIPVRHPGITGGRHGRQCHSLGDR